MEEQTANAAEGTAAVEDANKLKRPQQDDTASMMSIRSTRSRKAGSRRLLHH